MKRSARLLDMVHHLAGRRERSVEEIAERFGISARTAYRDIADLEEAHIPIVRGARGYRLVDGATLRPLNLTGEERALLTVLLDNPAFTGRAASPAALRRLKDKLDAATSRAEDVAPSLALAGPDRSGPVPPAVTEAIETAIRDRQDLEIQYSSLSGGKRSWRGVDPYRLFHREGAWYLAGRCHRHDEVRTFRLDRIGAVRPGAEPFVPDPAFSLRDYLRDSWGVLRGRRRHAIVLEVDPDLAPLFRHARFHPEAEIQETVGGKLEYRLKLSSLDEIARWVVGFGGRVRALEPAALVREVARLGEGAVRAHGGRGKE